MKHKHKTDEPSANAGVDEARTPTPVAALEELPVELPMPSREELDDLRARAQKSDENWQKYLRVAADLENFRKRAAREKQDTIRYANESLLQRVIPALDNFDMALAAAANAQSATLESLRTGITMVHEQFRKTLAELGLEEVDALGQPFDPNFHEAISQMESADAPEGQVLQQVRKGYKLRDRLLRPASVIVAKKPSAPN